MSAPDSRSLAGIANKLSRSVQRIARTKAASPFSLQFWGEEDVPVPVRAKEWARGRARVAPACGAVWRTQAPHLSPLPLAKGRGEKAAWIPQAPNTIVLA